MQYISLIPKNKTERIDSALIMREKAKRERKSSRIRLFLWTGMLIAALVVAVYPFAPLFMYHAGIFNAGGQENAGMAAGVEENEEKNSENPTTESAVLVSQDKNMLIIPKIGVNMEILGGNNAEYAWNRGAWLEPHTSTPDMGSNTVISAHRFNYRPPHQRTLYLLDKLEAGDTFSVFWEGEEYKYRVIESKITSPYALQVLEPSEKPIITIYTCNPIFSTKERLVVTAELVQ